MMRSLAIVVVMGLILGCNFPMRSEISTIDLNGDVKVRVDSLPAGDGSTRYSRLTDADFAMVAEELGIEIAVIKAVVLIEAGRNMKGFWVDGLPVINFSKSLYNKFSRTPSKVKAEEDELQLSPLLSGYALQEWSQLISARKRNCEAANKATYWGMFQIGGFNYRHCGCSTVQEMARLMSMSELQQLELFATFIRNTGMLEDLKEKNWSAFSRKYNGASYAKRGYHTRMAEAYRKYSSE